jgi:hypothetical protein
MAPSVREGEAEAQARLKDWILRRVEEMEAEDQAEAGEQGQGEEEGVGVGQDKDESGFGGSVKKKRGYQNLNQRRS